jgi:hypothetical protein
MILIGILVTLLGFVIAVTSVVIAHGVGGRLILVLIGLAVSLYGILGLLQGTFLKNAIWKSEVKR